jgi:hypothetical protein
MLMMLIVASKEMGLEGNADKTKCMVMFRDQNSGRSHSITIDNSSLERVERSKYSPQHHILNHPQLPCLPHCQ